MNRAAFALAPLLLSIACGPRSPEGASLGQGSGAMDIDLQHDLSGVEPVPMPEGEGPPLPDVPVEVADCPSGDAPDASVADAWKALVDGCAQWQGHDVHTYTYVVERATFGPMEWSEPVVVEVENGRVAQATRLSTDEVLDPAGFGTMEDVYWEMAEIAAQVPYRLDVQIDERIGVPDTMSVDWHEQGRDDWMVVQLSLLPR